MGFELKSFGWKAKNLPLHQKELIFLFYLSIKYNEIFLLVSRD